jgi:hypothetical protein
LALERRLSDLASQPPGVLRLLVYLFRGLFLYEREPLQPATIFISLLQRCWSTGIYHLRLEAVELAGMASRVKEPLRTEVENILESFLGANVFLNSAIVEALAGFKDLGFASEEGARSEVAHVLSGARNSEACTRAAVVFGKQFEDVFQDYYYCAIDELDPDDAREFHIKVLLGKMTLFSATLR